MFSKITTLLMFAIFAFSLKITADDFPEEKGTIPIAGWDVVPYQIIDQSFKAGVVAFHENSVQVNFIVSAGGKDIQQEKVLAPKLNDRTNVWEYFITVDPAKIPDGPFDIKATCIPGGNGNRPVSLPPLTLYANAKKSLQFKTVFADASKGDDANSGTVDKPFKTLVAAVKAAGDGGTAILMPGQYSPDKIRAGNKRIYWTTIQAAEGVKTDDVQITKGRPSTDKLYLKNVSVVGDFDSGRYNAILAGENGKNIIWLDNCKVFNKPGRYKGNVSCFANKYVAYVTGGMCTEIQRGTGAELMRNYKMSKLTEDGFTDVQIAINSHIDDIDPNGTGAHPDFHQTHVGDKSKFKTGVILYNCSGIKCKAQGFFGHNLKDSAFVNCLYVKKPDNHFLSQYSGKLDHVLFFHLTVPNQSWLWRGNLKMRNCYMIDSILFKMSTHAQEGADLSGITMAYNHFIGKNSTGKGENETSGPAEFADPEKNDYRLKNTSPAYHNGRKLATVPADINGKPWSKQAPDRGAFASE